MNIIKGLLLACLIITIPFKSPVADTFQEKPMTRGTAYTLNKGEWIIHGLGLSLTPSKVYFIPHLRNLIQFSYGFTSRLQLGTNLLSNFYGELNIHGKYHFLHFSNFDIAVPFWFGVEYVRFHLIGIESGVATSWRIIENVSIHSRGLVMIISGEALTVRSKLRAIIDLTILPNMKLLASLGLEVVEGIKSVGVGLSWRTRLLNFLNLGIGVTPYYPLLIVSTSFRF